MDSLREEELIREEARVWHAQLTSGHASARDRASFEAWQASDSRCAEAYAAIEALRTAMASDPVIAAMLAPPVLAARVPRARGVHPWLIDRMRRGASLPLGSALAMMLLAAVFFVGYVATGPAPILAPTAAYQATDSVAREIRLNDGSVVTLAAGARVEVAYEPDRRLVRLTAGAASFAVAKDKARPFVVVAGNTSVRAVGTRFKVRLAAREVKVSVEEGVVQVFKPASPARAFEKALDVRPVVLRAGEQVIAAADTGALARPAVATLPRAAPPVAPGSADRRLRYVGAPLSVIVADAAARGKKISIASPQVGAMKLTTSFRASDIDAVIDNLPDVLPVEVVRSADGSAVISARK